MAKWALEKATGEEDAQVKALLEKMEEKWDCSVLEGSLPVMIFVRAEELNRLREWAGMPKDLARGDITFRNTEVMGVMPGDVFDYGKFVVGREEDMLKWAASSGKDPVQVRFAPLGEWSCWLIAVRMGDLKADSVA